MGAYSSDNPELPLNAKEREIFDVLLGTVRHYELGTVVRVAGGWVRDKLLKKEKDDVDIDIAVDNMSGEEFAFSSYQITKSTLQKTTSPNFIVT